jgi:hypothetical protein
MTEETFEAINFVPARKAQTRLNISNGKGRM